MYISCTECNTRFSVNEEHLGANGRKVKCSRCSHTWHQKIEKDSLPPEPALNLDESPVTQVAQKINLPVLIPAKTHNSSFFMMPVIITGLILLMLTILFQDNINIDSWINQNNLAIEDIKIDKDIKSKKITVSYKVHNLSSSKSHLPLVRIRFFDQNNNLVKSLIRKNNKITIPPNQLIKFKTDFKPKSSNIDKIDIMIGNKIDFLLR